MSVTTIPFFYTGQVITVRGQGTKLFRVTKVNQVNLKAEGDDGRNYTVPMTIAQPSDRTFTAAPKAPTSEFFLGDLVKIKSNRYPGLFVVIKKISEDRYSVAEINGRKNTWVKVSGVHLERVEL